MKRLIKHGSKYYIGTTEDHIIACNKSGFEPLNLPEATPDEIEVHSQLNRIYRKNKILEDILEDLYDRYKDEKTRSCG